MIPIDVKIESLIHRGFVDFQKVQNIDTLAGQLKRYARAGYGFRLLDSVKGEVNDLITMVESGETVDPAQEEFGPFIKAEKLAALRLLKFNSAAELAEVERILDLPNQLTTTTPPSLKPVNLIMFYGVFIKGGHLYLLIDTNYYQFHWALKKLIRSLRTKS